MNHNYTEQIKQIQMDISESVEYVGSWGSHDRALFLANAKTALNTRKFLAQNLLWSHETFTIGVLSGPIILKTLKANLANKDLIFLLCIAIIALQSWRT